MIFGIYIYQYTNTNGTIQIIILQYISHLFLISVNHPHHFEPSKFLTLNCKSNAWDSRYEFGKTKAFNGNYSSEKRLVLITRRKPHRWGAKAAIRDTGWAARRRESCGRSPALYRKSRPQEFLCGRCLWSRVAFLCGLRELLWPLVLKMKNKTW